MKQAFFLTGIIFFLCGTVIWAQQTDEQKALEDANSRLVIAFRMGDYRQAAKFARRTIELSTKAYGAEHAETAIAYRNLAASLEKQLQFKEAAENHQKALDFYQKNSKEFGADYVRTTQDLASVLEKAGEKREAAAAFRQAVEIAERIFGAEAKPSFPPVLATANFYTNIKEFGTAREFYVKARNLALKNFGAESREAKLVKEGESCLSIAEGFDDDKGDKKKSDKDLNKSSSVVNGKAKYLAKPSYPREIGRTGGVIPVAVKINEIGEVTEAKATCGNPYLKRAAESAAIESKFSVTTMNGKPVSVTGIIVYNFVVP